MNDDPLANLVMTTTALETAIAACAADIERFLDARLILSTRSPRLAAAMRHGALDGGKRLRPFLVRASAELFGVSAKDSLAAGAAIEMIHCYSLVHDDLPDMDNDELRRGKPTVWKAFDPALAILAGDALLTEAFAVLSDASTHSDPLVRSDLIAAMSLGANQMVDGQVLDIEGETDPLDEDGILKMQALKTGALIRTACEMGAILGRASNDDRAALIGYGLSAGAVFQIADDILDVTATSQELGKTAGKDIDQNKSTIVARSGLETAYQIIEQSVEYGTHCLERFGTKADTLRALIRHFASRKN